MTRITLLAVLVFLALALSEPGWAYVGPGSGLSQLGALWGLIAVVGIALLCLIAWPLQRLMRRRRAQSDPGARSTGSNH